MKRTQFLRKPTDAATLTVKVARTRKCAVKGCAVRFTPRNMAHKACGPEHAQIVATAARVKAERMSDRARKVALKTRQDWLKEAQTVFNAFIRARDTDMPCISCGQCHDRFWDAGHYRSIGAQPALRFDENNVHKQCVHCNQHKGGNIVEYRIRLVRRIGREAVELLEIEHEPAKYTIEDAKRIKAEYGAKLKALTARRGNGEACPIAKEAA